MNKLLSEKDNKIEGDEITDPKTNAILKDRALRLSKERAKPLKTKTLDMFEFKLENETYGIEISYISKVHFLKDLTYLPGMPPHVLGIINVHGVILPVIDLRILFEFQTHNLAHANSVIVVTVEESTFGILINEALGVMKISVDNIEPTLPTLTGVREKFTQGISFDNVIILNPQKLAHDETIVIDVGNKGRKLES